MFLARTHVGTAEHEFFEVETPTAVAVLPSWALRGRGIEAARAVRAQAAAAREAAVRLPRCLRAGWNGSNGSSQIRQIRSN